MHVVTENQVRGPLSAVLQTRYWQDSRLFYMTTVSVRLKLARTVGLMQCARLGQSARTMLAACQRELVLVQKRKPPSHVIAIGSVQAMRVVVQRQMMVQHSSVVQAVLQAPMGDTTTAQGWPLGQPAGPMTNVRLTIARAMGVVYRRENVRAHQRRTRRLAPTTESVQAMRVVVFPRTTRIQTCTFVAMQLRRMRVLTTAKICQ